MQLVKLSRTYVSLDIETTITPYMKRKASPFHPENWVVAAGWKHGGASKVVGAYYGEDRRGSNGVLRTILAGNPMFVVTFNGKFDIQHLLNDPEDYAVYRRWVASGGLIWDSQLVEYQLQGMVPEAQMLSLDEVAPLYGGDLKIDEVKAYWEQGINTPAIPRQLLMDYLVGREGTAGDVENTERIFKGQMKAVKEAGMLQTVRLNLGALMASIEMERNGMFIDRARGMELAEGLRAEIARTRAAMQEYLPKDLPFEFNWGSPRQRSALIFGGGVTYQARTPILDDKGQQVYSQMDVSAWIMEDGSLLRPDGDDMSEEPPGVARFAGGKNKGQAKSKKVKVNDPSKPKSRMEDYVHPFPGYVKPRKEWEGETPGVYSTKADIIEELALSSGVPFLEDYGKLMASMKDLGTYYITEDEKKPGQFKGMLTLLQDDNIIHHGINHTSTITGRLSHSNPNMGNLPREDTSNVKQMFISRFAGGSIISSDFKTLEIYAQAMLTGDKQLIADLRKKLDMHVARLSTVEDKTYEVVLRLAKGYVAEDGTKVHAVHEWDVKRTKIKVFSFQRAYGAGAKKIASYLKVPVDDVEKWIEADKLRYPGVEEAFETLRQTVEDNAVDVGRWDTHPTERFRINLRRSRYQTFDGKVYTFTEQPSPDFLARKGTLTSFTPTELRNYPVQGLGGEWMKAAMWNAVRAFYFTDNFDGLALLINTVHDALYGDSDASVSRKAGVMIHAAMLAASDLIEYLFKTEVPVPVPSDTTYGPSMFEEGHYDDAEEFEASARRVRMWMRKAFMNNYVPSFGE